MKFFDWITQTGGAVPCARILKSKPHTVRKWLRKEATPNYPTIAKILKASKGEVTIEAIVIETNKGRKRKC